jgi:hypothetical protein
MRHARGDVLSFAPARPCGGCLDHNGLYLNRLFLLGVAFYPLYPLDSVAHTILASHAHAGQVELAERLFMRLILHGRTRTRFIDKW